LKSLRVKRVSIGSPQRFNAPPARVCSTKRPAILGSSNGNEHRIPFNPKARFQTCEKFCKKGADQIARPVSKNVPRIDTTTGYFLGARSEGAGLAKAVEKSARLESAVREMVRRGSTPSFRELSRSSS